MMKQKNIGTVMKVTEQYIVVLCMEGTFKNLPRSAHELPMIGDEMHFSVAKGRNPFHVMWKKYALMASCILMLIVALSVIKSYTSNVQPAYILAIDINPSIELYTDEDLIIKQSMY